MLLRARAIETQAYVIAAAQIGRHNEKRVSYGRSLIVNPWGEIIAQLPSVDEIDPQSISPAIVTADIDIDYIDKVRTQIPLLRRTDIYPEV
ncbi:hydrolase, carbon-nitrogen family protein [Ascosphaera apis ARSEF 7405]|uniref:Hydrolase, carbon-nitrogen family protein n=1 Tax=Ascosphaera apis ARSEF 7405 TaxID=392613 RepID=A0A168D1S1_9EURO|nr:hydrolase, carbon-nitrogen family protein [Ascosphaera apis ARSEF 7405]